MDQNGTLDAGTLLGPYEILSPLAGGGMGRVYRARDQRLGRMVAIKVLSPDLAPTGPAIARLRREAEAASSLNHPSIVTIFDIGEAPGAAFFIAMELIDGKNLREWLRGGRPVADRIEVLLQVASGLVAAHARGIVHRDIKPENIVVTGDGLAKIVDFGLAKLTGLPQRGATSEAATDLIQTKAGQIVGTIAYMSPEQLRGEPLDASTDIFSFGCVLHESLAGRAPFCASSIAETIGRILRGDPDPLPRDTDPIAATTIRRCLAKERNQRYVSMEQVVADLRRTRESPRHVGPLVWRWASIAAAVVAIAGALFLAGRLASPPPPPATMLAPASIAVLPFRIVGSNADTYIADGLTDALTTDLAKQSSLTVIARNSANRYAASSDLRRAGDDLHVRYLLMGTVQNVAGRIRVNARLVDGVTDKHVWAGGFEPALSDIFSAEDAIVSAVAQRVSPKSAVNAPMPRPADARVADLYLRARFFADDNEWPTQDRSIPLLEEVTRLDPGFLPARIQLAAQYQRKAFQRDPDRAWEQKAFIEVQKILATDPNEAAAYVIRGSQRWTIAHGFAHDEALGDFDRAVMLDPNSVLAYNARAALLMHIGLLDEALADYSRVLRVDPFNFFAQYRVARVHLYQGKCAQAAAELKKVTPNDFQLPIALDCAGSPAEALTTVLRLKPGTTQGAEGDVGSARAVLLAKSGRREESRRAIRAATRGEGGSHFHHAMYYIAAAYAQLHDPDNALKWLERTSVEGMPCYPLFASDHLLDPIRSDARMKKFLDASRAEWEERRRARRVHAG